MRDTFPTPLRVLLGALAVGVLLAPATAATTGRSTLPTNDRASATRSTA